MGNSYVDYQGCFVRLNDRVLEVARHFLAVSSRSLRPEDFAEDIPRAFESFVADWVDIAPGLCGADFDTFVMGDTTRRDFLLAALHAAQQRVGEFGDEIPLEYLRSELSPSTTYFVNAFPVELVSNALSRLANLVNAPNSVA